MVKMAALIIVVLVLLLMRDFQYRRAREDLALERASRREAVEAALTEGFRLGTWLREQDPSGAPVDEDRVPAGMAGGAL